MLFGLYANGHGRICADRDKWLSNFPSDAEEELELVVARVRFVRGGRLCGGEVMKSRCLASVKAHLVSSGTPTDARRLLLLAKVTSL